MHSERLIALILGCCAVAWPAEAKFKLIGTAEMERGTPVTVDIDYTGALPPGPNPFQAASSWKVFWSSQTSSPLHAADVDGVDIDVPDQKIRLHLAGDLPPAGSLWSVLFNPAGPPYILPIVITGTPSKPPPTPPASAAAPEAKTLTSSSQAAQAPAKKNCSNQHSSEQPFFCPAAPGQTPDMRLTASFLAAGGTKPIYSLSLKGALQLGRPILGFDPGFATDVEINQDLLPPVNSTTFNPDSITVGLAFTRIVPVQHHQLYGVKLQLGLPSAEFSVSDPSSAILVNPTASFVFNSWQPKRSRSLFATFYPFMAVELGQNLSKPATIESVPVNLSNYNAIARGVLGTDAALDVATPDRKGSVFSLTGSYRLRLPAFDEPEVRTLHQVTTIDLTTKARNWVEADLNYAPWSFKYLAITAKYQYGELPPLFKLVDHSFTLGLTLQATQTHKTR